MVLSFSMPLTVLICAIWLVTWALSIGLRGSWFFICATSSLRNRSPVASWALAVEAADGALVTEVLGETTLVMLMGANLQGLTGPAAGS